MEEIHVGRFACPDFRGVGTCRVSGRPRPVLTVLFHPPATGSIRGKEDAGLLWPTRSQTACCPVLRVGCVHERPVLFTRSLACPGHRRQADRTGDKTQHQEDEQDRSQTTLHHHLLSVPSPRCNGAFRTTTGLPASRQARHRKRHRRPSYGSGRCTRVSGELARWIKMHSFHIVMVQFIRTVALCQPCPCAPIRVKGTGVQGLDKTGPPLY